MKKIIVPAEGRTFLRTLGAQPTSVRPFVRPSKCSVFLAWLWFEKQNETEHVYVP